MRKSKKTPTTNIALLKMSDVEAMTTLKRTLIYKLIGQGQFPKQIKLGDRRSAWRVSEVNEFIGGRRDWA